MADAILQSLEQHFGFGTFLDGQEPVVRRILDGENLCVIMPTGAGKSLCYQLPALLSPGYSLVISPLISLMKDQVDALLERNIPAAFINSTLTPQEQQQVLSDVVAGQTKLLYIAPERFASSPFRRLINQHPPTMVVVDEAHCISQWGHDFRPQYARIGEHLGHLPIPQVCAFTATATPVVKDDIVRQLHRDMAVYVTGFTRPNLSLSVRECAGVEAKIDTIKELLRTPQTTIIYAATRKHVDLIGDRLNCIRYHAGLTDAERTEAQDRFMQDPHPVVAATNAFGMGIDRPDVRQVIHFNIPGSLEAYYQEAGRAGRDGEDAKCMLMFSYQDRYIHEFLIDMNNPPRSVVLSTYQALRQISQQAGDAHLEVTQADLASRVPGIKGEAQVSAALKVLDKYGYIARGFRHQNRGSLRVQETFAILRQRFPEPNTQRALFVHRVCKHYGEWLHDGVSCTYDDLNRITGLSPEQVRRVVRALNGREFLWVPPFAGRGLTLLQADVEHPEIDFAAEERHRDLEMKRLDDIFAYPKTQLCRQQFIIDYFGQPEKWQCGVCDRCRRSQSMEHRVPTAAETEIVQQILQATKELAGRFGRNRVAQVLCGSKSQAIIAAGLHHKPIYGALRSRGQPFVLQLLRSLIDTGCIKTVGDSKYPRVALTPLGEAVLKGEQQIAIEFQAGAAVKEHESADTAGMDDLYERLQRLRNSMAEKRRVPAYAIFNNGTLRALADQAPMSVADASGIKGIGPKRSKSTLPRFLEEIAAWRRENDLAES